MGLSHDGICFWYRQTAEQTSTVAAVSAGRAFVYDNGRNSDSVGSSCGAGSARLTHSQSIVLMG